MCLILSTAREFGTILIISSRSIPILQARRLRRGKNPWFKVIRLARGGAGIQTWGSGTVPSPSGLCEGQGDNRSHAVGTWGRHHGAPPFLSPRDLSRVPISASRLKYDHCSWQRDVVSTSPVLPGPLSWAPPPPGAPSPASKLGTHLMGVPQHFQGGRVPLTG